MVGLLAQLDAAPPAVVGSIRVHHRRRPGAPDGSPGKLGLGGQLAPPLQVGPRRSREAHAPRPALDLRQDVVDGPQVQSSSWHRSDQELAEPRERRQVALGDSAAPRVGAGQQGAGQALHLGPLAGVDLEVSRPRVDEHAQVRQPLRRFPHALGLLDEKAKPPEQRHGLVPGRRAAVPRRRHDQEVVQVPQKLDALGSQRLDRVPEEVGEDPGAQ